jgi:hypothetical protein
MSERVSTTTRLHAAVCDAVQLMNRCPIREAQLHEAHNILREALVSYADSATTDGAAVTDEMVSAALNEWFGGEAEAEFFNKQQYASEMRSAIHAALAAHDAAQPCGEVGEPVLMPRALTAENGAKAALMGEFKVSWKTECPECFGMPSEDADEEECSTCGGAGETTYHVDVEWTTIKEIYKRAVELLGTPPPASQPKQGEGEVWPSKEQFCRIVGEALEFFWNDHCMDTGCFPADITLHNGKKNTQVEFRAGSWVRYSAERAYSQLTPPTHPAQATIKDGEGDVVHRSAYDMAITGRREFRQMYRDERAKVAALTAEIARLREESPICETHQVARVCPICGE